VEKVTIDRSTDHMADDGETKVVVSKGLDRSKKELFFVAEKPVATATWLSLYEARQALTETSFRAFLGSSAISSESQVHP